MCVTHQSQVTGQEQHHLRIGKRTENKQTFSKLTMLNHDKRIAKIAHMVGGVKITEQVPEKLSG